VEETISMISFISFFSNSTIFLQILLFILQSTLVFLVVFEFWTYLNAE